MRHLRILIVTNMFPPHHFGGYELSCLDAVTRFTAAGDEVMVLTSTITVEGAGPERHDSVRRQLGIYWRDHELTNPWPGKRLATEISNQRALRRALADFEPDVVSVWNMGAMSLGLLTTLRATGIPVVFVIGDDWPNYSLDLDAWSRMFRGRRCHALGMAFSRMTGLPTVTLDYSDMGACLFNSRAMREVVARRGIWSMPVQGIVYTGVEAADFPVAAEADPIPERPWAGRLLYVGRLDERKGITTVVEALPSLPGARLRIVGRGDAGYLERLRTRVRELDLEGRVSFTSCPRTELTREYESADALIFPSVYPEPFGIVPLEAMACDTPVIGTGSGGSGEYLVDGWNCLRYEAGNTAGLTAAVGRMASDSGLRAALIRGGRRTAQALTTEAWMESLSAWHASALHRFKGPLPPDRDLHLGS